MFWRKMKIFSYTSFCWISNIALSVTLSRKWLWTCWVVCVCIDCHAFSFLAICHCSSMHCLEMVEMVYGGSCVAPWTTSATGSVSLRKNTILIVETVNIQPSKPKTTQDITLPSLHQFFNVFCATNGLTSCGMTAMIKCTDNFCFISSFSNAPLLPKV